VDPLFGELYLRSTKPFLKPSVTAAEASFLRARLPARGLIADIGCGHGRHLEQLHGLELVGIDGDRLSLANAERFARVLEADLRALPLESGQLAGAYCWYNTLGTFEEAEAAKVLSEISRCLAPGGTFIIQGTNPAPAREAPYAYYCDELPGDEGAHLEEDASFDASTGRDQLSRRLELADGRVLSAEFFIRYYDLDEWRAMLAEAGLDVKWVCGAIDGSVATDASLDLIVGATKLG
jgi:SAM-dependent methyltransferase